MVGLPYPHLFAPLKAAGLLIPNRVVMGAMHTGIERLDRADERIREFYRARAEGGVGLIITGGVSPNSQGRMDGEAPVLAQDENLSWHRAIIDSVDGTDAKICMQILHAGRYAKVPDCVGASARKSRITKHAPRALSTEDVWRTIDEYARTAAIARDLGYHGAEIMGSEGYLINQFTALAANDREDEFGGSFENRARLPQEIVKAVRRRVGKDFLIIYRISVVDLVPNGMTGEETLRLARLIEEAGADILNTGIGWHESTIPTIANVVPRAAWSYAIRPVKDAVGIPIIASNRINDPQVAEDLIAEGTADFVSMARPLLADPDFAAKAKANRPDRINTCIACNQACLDRALRSQRVSCLVNPRAGHEIEFDITPVGVFKKIAVVGGGAAGMNFAFNAAARGHAVTLFEAAERLGGQLLMARVVPDKAEFDEALRYFERRLVDEKVDLRLGHAPSAQELSAGGYDEIVIATGVRPRRLDIRGIGDPKVLSYADVLLHRRPVGARVAIIGAGGIGFDVAAFLLGDPDETLSIEDFAREYGLDLTLRAPGGLAGDDGQHPPRRQITLMQRKNERPAGNRQAVSTSWIHRARLHRSGVQMLGGVDYKGVVEAGLLISIDGQERLIPADTIVVCAGQDSERSLYDELLDRTPTSRVHVIGGADKAIELDAMRAIDQGTRLAMTL
jgi:2,4-dienoyl-CoA reductase (NADPH2)